MKRFSELQNELISQDQTEIVNNPTNQAYPDYMLNDTNFIGYQDEQLQSTVYRAAEFGTILTGTESVLDIGCGRGDFGNYLLKKYPGVQYTGIDLNDIMIDVGKQKYSEHLDSGKFNLHNSLFDANYEVTQTHDWVYHITDMTVNYGIWPDLQTEGSQYEFITMMINKSYQLCNTGMVFILLNDREYTDGYISYSMTPISKILYDMNLKFAIDNTDIPTVFKLVILKDSF